MPRINFTKTIWVSPDTHRKVKLLAALLNVQMQETVDLAITKMLEEVQAKEKEQWLDERRVEATQQAERYRGELTTCSIKLAETISELHSAQQLNSVLQSRLEAQG